MASIETLLTKIDFLNARVEALEKELEKAKTIMKDYEAE